MDALNCPSTCTQLCNANWAQPDSEKERNHDYTHHRSISLTIAACAQASSGGRFRFSLGACGFGAAALWPLPSASVCARPSSAWLRSVPGVGVASFGDDLERFLAIQSSVHSSQERRQRLQPTTAANGVCRTRNIRRASQGAPAVQTKRSILAILGIRSR